jgi:hypothetical protein
MWWERVCGAIIPSVRNKADIFGPHIWPESLGVEMGVQSQKLLKPARQIASTGSADDGTLRGA